MPKIAAKKEEEQPLSFGPVTTGWLKAIGVLTVKDIKDRGAVEVFRALVEQRFNPSVVMIYVLEGAILDIHWNQIPKERQEELKREATAIKLAQQLLQR